MKQETSVTASEFKAKCLVMLDRVAEGTTLVVTKRGRPFARVVPFEAPRAALRGTWRKTVKVKGDIVRFNAADDWENA